MSSYFKGDIFISNPWEIGDFYAYCLHTKKAQEYGLKNKYILFQKIGDVEYYKNVNFSVVQIFTKVFDEVPSLNETKNLHVLPLLLPVEKEGVLVDKKDYIPSFEWYTKASMMYEKKSQYPQKHFIFIGNKSIPTIEYCGNDCTDFFLHKSKMEMWIIDYLMAWDNISVERVFGSI